MRCICTATIITFGGKRKSAKLALINRAWVGQTGFVDATPSSPYQGHRYPVEIISHWVWLYHRFPLSLREVEEMMLARGVVVMVMSRRDATAATRFFRKLLRGVRSVPHQPTRQREQTMKKFTSLDVSHTS